MHDHTTKSIATLESEALIKAVDTLEAETILTKAVAAAPEHVGTLDVMRVTVGEESNGAITLPGEDGVPTTAGDTLGRDGGRDEVAKVPACTASLILHRPSYPAPPYPAPPSLSRAPRLTCAASLRTRIVVPQAQPHAPRHYTRGSL